MTYRAPLKDMLFTMQELAHIGAIAELPGFTDAGIDTAQAVLEECAKFNEGRRSRRSDARRRPAAPRHCRDGVVTTPPGFKRGVPSSSATGGWQGVQHPTEFGGQGLPKLIGTRHASRCNNSCGPERSRCARC